ncbi:hypothetical protein Amsp01_073590 [Amycolatopsis sp. NBRC 101858]|uniref:hypothetical protein n=1 Tax=Amycolatopsis sp. NBRC 101858 TaxID=3032200 RepID=UPI0024A04148|nr:hypothetical protein [Amycolatopsis sp. NBRC 101858]GLY41336.1 hypothetical protein Amsp01_073590 [Amycolatopsis sp. NBRC 101858]
MPGGLVAPAAWAVAAGAGLTFAVYGILESVGPVERAEAVVEVSHDYASGSTKHIYHLVLRTASGELFEAEGSEKGLGVRVGDDVGIEISAVGREVQAVRVYRRRVPTDAGESLAFWAVLAGGGALVGALAKAAETRRALPAALSTAAGLAAGVAPALLLF